MKYAMFFVCMAWCCVICSSYLTETEELSEDLVVRVQSDFDQLDYVCKLELVTSLCGVLSGEDKMKLGKLLFYQGTRHEDEQELIALSRSNLKVLVYHLQYLEKVVAFNEIAHGKKNHDTKDKQKKEQVTVDDKQKEQLVQKEVEKQLRGESGQEEQPVLEFLQRRMKRKAARNNEIFFSNFTAYSVSGMCTML